MKITVNLAKTREFSQTVLLLSMLAVVLLSSSVYYGVKIINNYKIIGTFGILPPATAAISPVEKENIKKKADFINSLIDKNTFPWLDLLAKFEETIPDNVALEKLVPDFKNKTINITGVGDDISDVTEYVEKLQGVSDFQKILLLETSNGKEGIEFKLSITMK